MHLYVEAGNTTPKDKLRYTGYILEYERKDGTVHQRDGYMQQAGSYNNAILKTLAAAVDRLEKPCEIHIHTQNGYILNAVSRYLPQWAENDYRTAKGEYVKDHFDWMMLYGRIRKHFVVPEPGMHIWYSDMMQEMKNLEKADKS